MSRTSTNLQKAIRNFLDRQGYDVFWANRKIPREEFARQLSEHNYFKSREVYKQLTNPKKNN